MKLSDYIAQNGDREIDSEKLDEVLQIKRSKVWKPECGERYWFISDDSTNVESEWEDDVFDRDCWEIGNVFPTEEAAQAHLKYLETRTALKRYAQEHNEGEIDWNNAEQNKWCIYYNYSEDRNKISCTNSCKDASQIYFTSEELVKSAINEIGEERIKQYLLYEG